MGFTYIYISLIVTGHYARNYMYDGDKNDIIAP